MAKFRKKPVVIEATQWFKNGDFPEDDSTMTASDATGDKFLAKGKVVRRFRDPEIGL